MTSIAEFKGQNGKIIIYEDSIIISRKSFGGFISQGGFSGDRRYFYKDISSVEYKRPNFVSNGYFKIIVQGTTETNAKVGLLGSSMKSAQDQNTVILRAFSKKVGDETDRIHQIIMEKLSETKTVNSTNSIGSSKMDELKKLGELKASGVLTDEEFQIEKAKILADQ